ncbi:MAG: hypothetical protein MUO63_16570, partial [Desulfobulbaceae bacterium]|nr:hypothetical protein [Desulfobulbaceae bacterium]
MQRMILSFVAGCILGIGSSTLYAFDNNKVHRSINENSAQQSVLDQYVRDVIGFDNGLETYFAGIKIIEHLKDGGTAEDRLPRFFNHFHDPLEPWENAGLSWLPGIRSASCLIWAQNYAPLEEDTNQEEWFQARRSFYEALTTGSTEKYATTFKVLGRLMHLVSDMAVPAHVR